MSDFIGTKLTMNLGKYFAPCCYIRLGGIMDVEKEKNCFSKVD